ncbi:DUF3795 domain-containing protein [Dehalococcoidia bacterium]|nr:DUF3795 domain-containing protein [Dehalococcoidia bacterium]
MQSEKVDKLIAPCGHYCGWCPYYYAKGSKESKCPGCWESDEGCEIRECAQSRSLRLCTFCSDFPCSKLYDLYSKMHKYFDRVKKDFPKGVRQEGQPRRSTASFN